MDEHKCQVLLKPIETIRNQTKSWFSQFLYKTNNISQNLKNDLHVLKTQNPTKSKPWFKVSYKMIPKISLSKIKNLFGDDSRYPTMSHKKKGFVPNVDVLDFVEDFFWGMLYVYIYIYTRRENLHTFGKPTI